MIKELTNEESEKLVGRFNDPLPNMKEITMAEWARSPFFTYSPDYHGYKQISKERLAPLGIESENFLAVTWFMLQDKTGIALHGDYWGERVRVFKFAVCEHSYTERKVGKCLHEYTCSKCGFKKTIDSSD